MAIGPSDVADYSIIQTEDQGFVVAGYYDDGLNFAREMFLQKMDASGNVTWLYRYGTSMLDECHAMQETSDGGFILAGLTRGFGAGNNDMFLVKTNSSGIPEWSRAYGHTGNDYAYAVKQTSDGGYIVSGKGTTGLGGTDLMLLRTDATGNITWSKSFGTAQNEDGYSVQQTADGGFIVTGSTGPSSAVNLLLVKTDSSGTLQWAKTYASLVHNYGRCVRITSDGGYVIAGYTDNTGITSADGYLVKTDNNGNLIWSRTYGIGSWEELLYCVVETADGGYILSGYTNTAANGHDVYVVKTDNQGISGCNEADGLTTVNTPTLQEMNDSLSFSSGGGMYVSTPQLSIEGTYSTLCLVTNTNETVPVLNTVSVFPNPSGGIATVSFKDYSVEAGDKICITNTLGQVTQAYELSAGQQTLQIDFKDSKGIYFITLTGKAGIVAAKVAVN
jgi:hypothetical protein